MVSRLVRVGMLDRKLLRDLWEMRGQALAIAAVIAAGVTMFVTYLSNFESLQRTRERYYERARFADLFAGLVRAPDSLAARIAALPGVAAVDTRVVADVTLDVPAMREPAAARLVSLAAPGAATLNDVYLRKGRWPDRARADEVVASEVFCKAHGFQPGDRIAAIINGRRRLLTITGIGLSPEYVYAVRPGEIFPDRRRFGVFWMAHSALAAAFDMDGAFNDVSIKLSRGVSAQAVIGRLDPLLAPYGGRGAIPRALQTSAWTVENELGQLQMFGFILPLIFLGVAAFILNVALARALALQRTQIAALKALGYSNRELGWHYTKWALAIALGGALGGVVGGRWLGAVIVELYNDVFRFPTLDFQVSAGLAAESVVGSLIVAALGAQTAVRRALAVPPAEAMRPESPARFHASLLERLWRRMPAPIATRIALRNIERQPVRSAISIVGIGFAVGVLFVGLAFNDVMERLIDEQLILGMRQDATLALAEPRGARFAHDVAHLPGVMDVEPVRSVPVTLRAGHRSRTLAITGVAPDARLNRVVDRRGRTVPVPPDGLLLSRMLADILQLRTGDPAQVQVLEGERAVRQVRVAALVDDSVGLHAYMSAPALHRLMREGPVATGAMVTLDARAIDAFYREVKATPAVAGVAMRALVLKNFRETMAENMNLSIFINVLFAAVIAFAVVYNSARVALSERNRELASLRVLGFTRAEIAAILLAELAVLTVVALPIGLFIGWIFGELIMAGFTNELYRLHFVVAPATAARACLGVLAAAVASALAIRRRLNALDLVAVLKVRE